MNVELTSLGNIIESWNDFNQPLPMVGDQIQTKQGIFKVQTRYFAFGSNLCVLYGVIL